MELRRFDNELAKLQAREFGSDVEALIELCRFSMFASACGYRGKAIKLTVMNSRIVQWPYGKPKPTLKKKEVVKEQIPMLKEKTAPVITVPLESPKLIPQEQRVKEENQKRQVTTAEKKASSRKKKEDEPEEKPLTRKGGPKPRALKREEKKGKSKRAKSRSSKAHRH